MISTSFYPTIDSLIPLNKLPEVIQPIVENAFDDIFYKNYITEKNKNGDGAFFSLSIVLINPLKLSFPGLEGFGSSTIVVGFENYAKIWVQLN